MANGIKWKQIVWDGNNPHGVMTSYTPLFDNRNIRFRIMYNGNGELMLMDFQATRKTCHIINTVDDGKKLAQQLYENYCDEIFNNLAEGLL